MPGSILQRGQAVATNLEFVDNGDLRPGWLSVDGATVYSWGKTGLYTSTDDAHTWQGPWHTFNQVIHGVRETNDGELLVSTFLSQGSNASLFRSSGWTANPATATWTEVLTPSGQAPSTGGLNISGWPYAAGTTGDRSNYFSSNFSFRVRGNVVVVCEYGKQANGTSIPGARYAYVSFDNGKPGTWALLRDLFAGPLYGNPDWTPGTLPFGSTGQHMHGADYDPWWDRFWITAGDLGCHTEYSDNHGTTWSIIPGSAPAFGTPGGQPGTTQSVGPFSLPDRVLFGTDGPNDGETKIERANGRSAPMVNMAHDVGLPHTGNLKYTAAMAYQRDMLLAGPGRPPRFPLLIPFYVGAGSSTAQPARIAAADPLGERFYDIWVDNQSKLPATGYGCFTALGPTANGKLLASINADGRSAGSNYTLMRADFPVIT